ncbi:hypothetical protein QQ045_019788 [Rhodiola kirilowii]
MDEFIPARERKATRSRFGFVRYRTLKEAESAVSRWNGTSVGRGRVVVKLVDNGGKPLVRHQPDSSRRFDQGGGSEQIDRLKIWRPKTREAPKTLKGSLLPSEEKRCIKRRVSLEVVQENEDWFHTSATADLKEIIPVTKLEKELRQNGIRFHKIIPMGVKHLSD